MNCVAEAQTDVVLHSPTFLERQTRKLTQKFPNIKNSIANVILPLRGSTQQQQQQQQQQPTEEEEQQQNDYKKEIQEGGQEEIVWVRRTTEVVYDDTTKIDSETTGPIKGKSSKKNESVNDTDEKDDRTSSPNPRRKKMSRLPQHPTTALPRHKRAEEQQRRSLKARDNGTVTSPNRRRRSVEKQDNNNDEGTNFFTTIPSLYLEDGENDTLGMTGGMEPRKKSTHIPKTDGKSRRGSSTTDVLQEDTNSASLSQQQQQQQNGPVSPRSRRSGINGINRRQFKSLQQIPTLSDQDNSYAIQVEEEDDEKRKNKCKSKNNKKCDDNDKTGNYCDTVTRRITTSTSEEEQQTTMKQQKSKQRTTPKTKGNDANNQKSSTNTKGSKSSSTHYSKSATTATSDRSSRKLSSSLSNHNKNIGQDHYTTTPSTITSTNTTTEEFVWCREEDTDIVMNYANDKQINMKRLYSPPCRHRRLVAAGAIIESNSTLTTKGLLPCNPLLTNDDDDNDETIPQVVSNTNNHNNNDTNDYNDCNDSFANDDDDDDDCGGNQSIDTATNFNVDCIEIDECSSPCVPSSGTDALPSSSVQNGVAAPTTMSRVKKSVDLLGRHSIRQYAKSKQRKKSTGLGKSSHGVSTNSSSSSNNNNNNNQSTQQKGSGINKISSRKGVVFPQELKKLEVVYVIDKIDPIYHKDLWWTDGDCHRTRQRNEDKLDKGNVKMFSKTADKYITAVLDSRLELERNDDGTEINNDQGTKSIRIDQRISTGTYNRMKVGISNGYHGINFDNYMDHVPVYVQKILSTYEASKRLKFNDDHVAKVIRSRSVSLTKRDRTLAALVGQICYDVVLSQGDNYGTNKSNHNSDPE